MALNDLTADLLTRIRNAVRNESRYVTALDNKLNRGVLNVLQSEGYIEGFDAMDAGPRRMLNIKLKYGPRGERLIHSIERVSKPGCRVYRQVQDIPRPLQGLGITVVSTSQGVLSDRACREKKVGGEVVAIVM